MKNEPSQLQYFLLLCAAIIFAVVLNKRPDEFDIEEEPVTIDQTYISPETARKAFKSCVQSGKSWKVCGKYIELITKVE